MNITLEIITILDSIDRNGSFEAAANELHKVRSALTYSIKKLENRLDIKIFDRSKYRARLTPVGRSLLDQGRHLLQLSNQIEQNIKWVATGWETVIRVSYDEIISTKPLFDLIKRFEKQCPQVNLELYSEVLGGCADALVNNRVDITIGITPPLPTMSNYIFSSLGKTKFVFAIAPKHPLSKFKEPLQTEIIKQYTGIIARDSSRLSSSSSLVFIPDQRRITLSTLELKKKAQILGIGAGFLPYNIIKDDIRNGHLIIKRVEREQPTTYCYFAYNKNKTGKAHKWLIQQLSNKNFQKKLLG